MAAAANLDWLYHLLGWLLAAAGIGLLIWALFRDRPRGRWRCPKCWYDMGGVPSPRCPECGKETTNERHMLRTRRRKGWALVGLMILLAGYPAYWARRIAGQGWLGALPTSPILWWVVHHEPSEAYRNGAMSTPTRFASELARRAGDGELAGWQWGWMLRGVGAVRARPVWPKGRPYAISTGLPHWLLPRVPKFEVASPFTDAEPQGHDHELVWSIGRLPENATSVTLKVKAGTWSGDWKLPVRQVAKPEDAITSVTSPEMDAAVRRAMYIGVRPDANAATNTNWILGVRVYRDKGPIPADLAIALRVDLLLDGQVRAGWPLSPHDSIYGEPVDWIRINLPPQAVSDAGRWTIRVRGDAAAALADVTRPRCWTGEYTVPLEEFIQK